MTRFKFVLYFFLVVIFSLNTIDAQTFDLQQLPSNKKQFEFRFLKPFLKNYTNQSFLSGTYKLSLNIPVSSKLNIIGEIPFIYSKYEINSFFGTYSFDKSGFGNIFIGAQTNPQPNNGKRSIVSFGVFLPTASENAAFPGVLTSYYKHQLFTPNTFGMYFNFAYQKIYTDGFRFGLEVGPNVVIPTTRRASSTELFLHYGITAGAMVNRLLFNVEVLGIAIVTEGSGDFGDHFVHQIDFGASWMGDNVIPKIFYKIYLKDFLSNSTSGVLGIGVSVPVD